MKKKFDGKKENCVRKSLFLLFNGKSLFFCVLRFFLLN